MKKGMREKAEQGIYPGHAPFGYRNNKAERTIVVDEADSKIVRRIFELTQAARTRSAQLHGRFELKPASA